MEVCPDALFDRRPERAGIRLGTRRPHPNPPPRALRGREKRVRACAGALFFFPLRLFRFLPYRGIEGGGVFPKTEGHSTLF